MKLWGDSRTIWFAVCFIFIRIAQCLPLMTNRTTVYLLQEGDCYLRHNNRHVQQIPIRFLTAHLQSRASLENVKPEEGRVFLLAHTAPDIRTREANASDDLITIGFSFGVR